MSAPIVVSPVPVGTAALLGPAVALNLWTFVMEGWMYATRIPAIQALEKRANAKNTTSSNERLTKDTLRHKFDEMVAPEVRWKADNYNHLHEQPTVFYSIIGGLALLGGGDKMSVQLAWTYVGLRIAHSLVQATVNCIPVRFPLFLGSSITLLGLTLRAAKLVF